MLASYRYLDATLAGDERMPRAKLTDRTIKALKPPEHGQVDYFDDSPRGFGIRVSQSGHRSFFVMYRFQGRLRRHTLGPYPHLTLATARQMAKDALHAVAHGKDPGADSERSRTRVPIEAEHAFRSIPNTDSDGSRTLIPSEAEHG